MNRIGGSGVDLRSKARVIFYLSNRLPSGVVNIVHSSSLLIYVVLFLYRPFQDLLMIPASFPNGTMMVLAQVKLWAKIAK